MQLTMVLLLALTCKATAQKRMLEMGIHSGMAMTRLYDQAKPSNDFYFCTVPSIGFLVSYGVSEGVFLSTELNYSIINTQREGLLSIDNAFPDEMFAHGCQAYFRDRINIDYLEIPLSINGQGGGRFRLFAGIGPFISVLLRGNRTTDGASFIYYDNKHGNVEPMPALSWQSFDGSRDITSELHAFNIGGCERFGFNYQLGRSTIWIETRYSFGQINIWKRSRFANVTHTDQLVFRAAYTIQL